MAFGTHSTHGKQHSVARPTPAAAPKSTSPSPDSAPVVIRNTKVTRAASEWATFSSGLGLTLSQARFARTFFAGHNGFLSGPAGTGKSYLVQAIMAFLTKKGINAGVCGTTGVASFLIGGQTLHSFTGIGLAEEPAHQLVINVMKNCKAKDRIKAIDVLFIDEVSMAKGDLLDKVEAVFRSIRHCGEPWGGVQLCCTGDWLQLGPVFRGDANQQLAFECEAWAKADIKTTVLKEQMRQRDDPVLLRVLGDVRVGDTSSLHLLDSRINATFPEDGIDPTRILCKNVDVDLFNASRLAALPGVVKSYKARDSGMPYHTDAFNRNCPAPQTLDLKVGAQVLLLVNIDVEDRGLVNGSTGVVTALGSTGVTVRFRTCTAVIGQNEWSMKEQQVGVNGKLVSKVIATRLQIPLKVCYAITVHRCQGATLDRAVIDLSEAFGYGMCYTALSRLRDSSSLSLASAIPRQVVMANPKCVAFYEAVGST